MWECDSSLFSFRIRFRDKSRNIKADARVKRSVSPISPNSLKFTHTSVEHVLGNYKIKNTGNGKKTDPNREGEYSMQVPEEKLYYREAT